MSRCRAQCTCEFRNQYKVLKDTEGYRITHLQVSRLITVLRNTSVRYSTSQEEGRIISGRELRNIERRRFRFDFGHGGGRLKDKRTDS
jgi:hypothetical protein